MRYERLLQNVIYTISVVECGALREDTVKGWLDDYITRETLISEEEEENKGSSHGKTLLIRLDASAEGCLDLVGWLYRLCTFYVIDISVAQYRNSWSRGFGREPAGQMSGRLNISVIFGRSLCVE
jgi:hypothetical protein